MKTRSVVLGQVAGAMILLSSLMHSVGGWIGLSKELARAGVGPDLTLGLLIGWQFGGAAMLAMGLIVVATFARARRGEVWLLPVRMIAVMYIVFGLAALAVSRGELFFLAVFVLPGTLLAIASRDA